MSELRLTSTGLTATVDTDGAQLTSLDTGGGLRLLWPGDAATWPDHAPTLFPVIGPLPGGLLRHRGRDYPMPAHGFARMSPFRAVTSDPAHAVLELTDSEETRAHYPFAFRFRVAFRVEGDTLTCVQSVENRSDEPLPVDLGFHPGFRWPLEPGGNKNDYVVRFAQPEPEPIRRGAGDPISMTPEPHPTPVQGDVLHLDDGLFADGPIVFDRPRSRSVTFGAPGGAALRVDFPDSPQLALWMWPGQPFLAIEPWNGLPAPVGFDGEIATKPEIALVAPGASLDHTLVVTATRFDS